MRRSFTVLLLVFCIIFNGCATIVSTSRQQISINTVPPGAKVYVQDIAQATTPAIIYIERSKEVVLRLEKESYQPVDIKLHRGINYWVAGNIIWTAGFLIGIAVDFINGSAYKLSPEEIKAILDEETVENINEKLPEGQAVLLVNLKIK